MTTGKDNAVPEAERNCPNCTESRTSIFHYPHQSQLEFLTELPLDIKRKEKEKIKIKMEWCPRRREKELV